MISEGTLHLFILDCIFDQINAALFKKKILQTQIFEQYICVSGFGYTYEGHILSSQI